MKFSGFHATLVCSGSLLVSFLSGCQAAPAVGSAAPGVTMPGVTVPGVAASAAHPDGYLAPGGGFADGGLNGEYFANANLSGQPAFARRDVRLDFDWGTHSPGGSASEPYKSFPADNFSIRWNGHLLPRFSETYTFSATSDDGLRLSIKAPSSTEWTKVIDFWPAQAGKPVVKTGTFAFKAGQSYDIRVETRDLGGSAMAKLAWASASTPTEIIEPASGLAINCYNDGFTDAMKNSADSWRLASDTNTAAPRDENGWPKTDAALLYLWNGGNNQGTYGISFKGKAAEVHDQFHYGEFSPLQYDAATNTSTGTFIVKDAGQQNFALFLTGTQRDANSPVGSGFTDLRISSPTTPGATTHYKTSETFLSQYKQAISRFVALRFMGGTNWNNSVNWNDRTFPDYSTQRLVREGESGFETNGMAWEYRVMLCNETGKDLYINIPETANDDYITKLAQLIRYGSDGRDPYTSEQANPVYPPLNSNLKVYVEYANEVWNVGFQAFHQNFDAAQAAIKNNTDEGKMLTYDGDTDANIAWNRRHAYESVRSSNLFRGVFGDNAMGDKVRVLHFWQYANYGWPTTALAQMDFLDAYFNNGDGKKHVATPHPISYYLWGAGGASYYGAENDEGTTDALKNGDFETGTDGWQTTGTVGVTRRGGQWDGPDAASTGGDDAPKNASYVYLQGDGTLTATFKIPAQQTANAYGLRFKAIQRKKTGASKQDSQRIQVLLDGQKIGEAFEPRDFWQTLNTPTFTAAPNSTHEIKLVGVGENTDDVAFIDDVALLSADAIFAADLPSSDLPNRVSGNTAAGYQERLNITYDWALLYGLKGVAYEGGWSLGGDAGGTPVQNWAKFNDPRTIDAQKRSIDAFYKSGGSLYTFGTYSQWDDWSHADNQPLVTGIEQSNSRLPVEPSNAVQLPAELTHENKIQYWGDKNVDPGRNGKVGTGSFLAWNVLVPSPTSYRFTLQSTAGGQAELVVDGASVASGASGGSLAATVQLTAGPHNVRVKSLKDSFTVSGVTISTVSDAKSK